jgi:hypothetical protein
MAKSEKHWFPCPHCGATDGWESWFVVTGPIVFNATARDRGVLRRSCMNVPLVEEYPGIRASLRRGGDITYIDRCKNCGEAIC